jgi:hypothetical protein
MGEETKEKADKLIENFYKKSNELLYSNLNENKKYAGWVSDFHLRKISNNEKIYLDLKKESDIFLLFALAIAWSVTGHWENGPYLISYIKLFERDNIEYWKKRNNINYEIDNRETNAINIRNYVGGIEPRQKICFRRDIFESIHILANKWSDIYNKLIECSKNNNYIIFMNELRGINGLCGENRCLLKKIPLILRELRCQNRFDNIPGDICCVVDTRVVNACEEIGLDIAKNYNSINQLVRSSEMIYEYFGDLYDIPLFAYNDNN